MFASVAAPLIGQVGIPLLQQGISGLGSLVGNIFSKEGRERLGGPIPVRPPARRGTVGGGPPTATQLYAEQDRKNGIFAPRLERDTLADRFLGKNTRSGRQGVMSDYLSKIGTAVAPVFGEMGYIALNRGREVFETEMSGIGRTLDRSVLGQKYVQLLPGQSISEAMRDITTPYYKKATREIEQFLGGDEPMTGIEKAAGNIGYHAAGAGRDVLAAGGTAAKEAVMSLLNNM